jgi:endo-1,4-beta-xylanase
MRFLLFFLMVLHIPVFAQIPEGGTILNAQSGTTYQRIGQGTLTQVDAQGQTFSKAIRYTTGTGIANTWDAQIKFPAVAGIATNDVILVAFYARTIATLDETGEGALMVCIEQNTTPHTKQIYYRISVGQEWKQYYASVKSNVTLASSAINYAFHVGFSSQTIEVADVKFLNFKNSLTLNDLPITEITYHGQSPDAGWRAEAEARINQHRKGVVDMVVYDADGELVKDAKVTIEMVRHQFGFGTAIDANTFINNTSYRNRVFEMFNEVVFENDLKWSTFNPSSPNPNIKRSLDTLENRKIAVRGHTVVWPSFRYNPSSVKNLENNPVALRNAIDQRIDQVTQHTKGRLIDWDVLNEPYSERDFQNILGNEVMADWFKRVRNNDRGVKMYINDFGILSGGGLNKVKQDGYYNIIRNIEENGGEIDGIGLQGHFGSDLTSIPRIYTILDRYAELGKEIKITEHDIDITQRAVQADYTRDLLTIVFSHPSVKSFLVWGFWAGRHWRPNAAFYTIGWTLLPHGEVWKDLIYNQWWTKKAESGTDNEGKVSFEGFLGSYKYTIESGEKKRTGSFRINHSKLSGLSNRVVLSFDNSIPDEVSIKATKPARLCEGEDITLYAPAGQGLEYKWYKDAELLEIENQSILITEPGTYFVKIIKGSMEIESPPFEVEVNRIPESVITPLGDTSFCPGGSVTLTTDSSIDYSYNWFRGSTKIRGSVTSLDIKESGTYSLVTHAKGCSAQSEPVVVTVFSPTDSRCTTGLTIKDLNFNVYPNPFRGSFTIESSALNVLPVSIELINSAGLTVYNKVMEGAFNSYTVQVTTPGLYTLRVSNDHEVRTVKLIGL